MKRIGRGWVIGIMAVAVFATVVWAGVRQHSQFTVSHTIDQTGDTAVVVKFNRFTGRDGYTYLDTIRIGTKIAVSWTAPKTVRRITVAAVPAVSTHDTIIVDHGTANDTITIDCDPALSRAVLCDSIVARINVASMSDTVTAEDSGTYVKVVCDLAQDAMASDTRFSLAYGTGNHNISATTAVYSDTCSPHMVCDSMVAKINATVTIKDTVTAAVSGDTVYTVTGRPGWAIVMKVGPADTCQDTTHVVNAQAAAWSSYQTDTFMLYGMYDDPKGGPDGFNAITGDIILRDAKEGAIKGYGEADSAIVKFGAFNALGQFQMVDSGSVASLPLTVHVATLANDTLWRHGVGVIVYMSDTATDTSGTYNHYLDCYLLRH